ncbi:hypothetical protein JYG23_14625 [Sedimentibacter sp. zth1]|uniref:hypothetical protein n=1 Tax=Sedimentibacter sp. zth1 TaxID=2816908 RepID=UPI001A92F2AA|nr:hypothetical protein [Sedimentibacter sp. zth1]QSX05876.1 hypothetical protein JYG23_14625 [Sedimentibacter sp. zth1]
MKSLRKSICIMILLSMMLSMFCSCNRSNLTDSGVNNNQNTDYSNDVINIWMYQDKSPNTKRLIPAIEKYCKEKNINYQMHCYSLEEMTYEDYILKRNINLDKANTIVFGGKEEMKNLNINHADYSNVSAFSNIADSCKCLTYIPISYHNKMTLINKNLLNLYEVECNKEIICKKEYYELIQQLIDKGAKFDNDFLMCELKARLLMEKYELILSDNDTQSSIDNTYIENLKKAVQEFVNINKDRIEFKDGKVSKVIIDEYTNLKLTVGFNPLSYDNHRYYVDENNEILIKSLKDTIIFFEPKYIDYAIYIGENVTNNGTFDLVNYMMSADTIRKNYGSHTFMLKNDCKENLLCMSTTDTELEDEKEYYIENAQEFVRIDNILNDNIYNGNINKEFINELMISSYLPNYFINAFISSCLLYCTAYPDQDVQSCLDHKLDDFITTIKLMM